MGVEVTFPLSMSKADCLLEDQQNSELLFIRLKRGLARWEKPSMNLLQKLTKPKNDWTSFLVVGVGHSDTLATLAGSIMMES